MILHISGRTDIVKYFTPWLINRLNEGFVDVENPFNKEMVSRICFEDVDIYVFSTKDPRNIENYMYRFMVKPTLFFVTITGYQKDIEPNVKNKKDIIECTNRLARLLGPNRVFVRYDPVFLNKKYNVDYHIRAFKKLCSQLDKNIKTIIVSFIDIYKNVKKNMKDLNIIPFTKEDYKKIGIEFSKIADENGKLVQTCAEENDLFEYGFIKGECLGKEFIKHLTGKEFPKRNARKNKFCNCVQVVDIGAYNTCSNYCKYCYANFDEHSISKNLMNHFDNSSLLIGRVKSTSKIVERHD